MSEQTFRYGPCELLVVAEDDTVGFITQGHDREDLDHDEVRKLIEFLQEIVGEVVSLAPEQLDMMPAGHEVYDVDGDPWVKQQDQRWQWETYSPRTSHSLVDTYGPITAKDGVGSSRHADKTETGDTP